MIRLFSLSLAVSFLLLSGCSSNEPNALSNPEEALASFVLEEGFQIELVAAEPFVQDPVAMDVDENGQIYVAEMPGYPLDTSPSGRIRLLKDSNQDGQIDDAVVFADSLVLPTGLMRWKQGLLVTAPPDVLYFEDTDNDGRADIRKVILTGFARSNPQHNFNAPKYGLDNGIYLANNGIIWTSAYKEAFGDEGTEVFYPDAENAPRLSKNANNRNVRFRPDTHELSSLSGRSQFGHSFDIWGRHFLANNANPQYHEVIAARYLERNPALDQGMAMHYTPDYGRKTTIYPQTRNPEHQLLTDRGMITSAAGITLYKGGLFPSPFERVSFVGEPVHNLVHALEIRQDGPTFSSHRMYERSEFLASTDSWFRPVNFFNGPDGALYIVDYYRQLVEHPEWMDEETAASDRLQNGNMQGRLYRVTPTGTPPASWISNLNLGSLSARELAEYLGHASVWWRLTAQRLLVDRGDAASIEAVREYLDSSPPDLGRLHGLWTLDGLNALEPVRIRRALGAKSPGLRENAIILTEKYLKENPQLVGDLFFLAEDPDPRVRFQLLCTLGSIEHSRSDETRNILLLADLADPWMQLASISGMGSIDENLLFQTIFQLDDFQETGRATYVEQLATLLVKNTADTETLDVIRQAMSRDFDTWWVAPVLKGIGTSMGAQQAQNPVFDTQRRLMATRFIESTFEKERDIFSSILEKLGLPDDYSFSALLLEQATNRQQSDVLRTQALSLLSLNAQNQETELLMALIQPEESEMVQKAAIRAVSSAPDERIAMRLLEKWKSLSPGVRESVLDLVMQDDNRRSLLLDAIDNGTVQRTEIGWNRTVVLMRDTSGPLKVKARELLAVNPAEREEVVVRYASTLEGPIDMEAGKETFTRVCSTCHQVAGEGGVAFGPDLGTVRHWSSEALLAKIIMPQRTIADGYGLWEVEKKDGTRVTGLMGSESETSITLLNIGSVYTQIPREEIESLSSLGASAMPVGLDQQLSQEEMRDLIGYLRFN